MKILKGMQTDVLGSWLRQAQKSIFTHRKLLTGLRICGQIAQNCAVDNRIAQVNRDDGSRESEVQSMVEDFLRTTYPQIISVLLTYLVCLLSCKHITEVYSGIF